VMAADDDIAYGRDVAVAGLEDAISLGTTANAAFFASNASEYDLHLGNLDAAAERVRRTLDLGLEASDQAANLSALRTLLTLRGDEEPEVIAEHERLCRVLGQPDNDMLTWFHLCRGELREVIDRGLRLAREDELNAPIAYLRIAIAAALAGDPVPVRAARDELAALGRWGRWLDTVQLAIRAIATALEGDRADGLRLALDVDAAFRQQGAMFDVVLAGLGSLAALRPLGSDTATLFASTRDLMEQLRLPPLLVLLDGVAPSTTGPATETATAERAAATPSTPRPA
jgi:ribosomal protein S14